MSTFIKLTSLTRNGLPFAKEILVDVDKISLPIVENLAGNSIIEVEADINYNSDTFAAPRDKFEVDHTLVQIKALSPDVFFATIEEKNGRPDFISEALFVKSRVIGVIEAVTPGGKSIFGYKVMAQRSPERYLVTENLATINA